jgi:ABC-type lipoprotein export system ATPase subunit
MEYARMPQTDTPILVAENVAKHYGATVVLRSVSLAVGEGESLAIVGPSGSGKSTLLNILGSLDQPSSGAVRLGDTDVVALRGDGLATFRATSVGFVFQDHHLLPQLTATENVLLPTLASRRMDADERARALLDRMGAGHRAMAFPGEMSGGERQRVAVARALINRPRLLLCDEPTGSLDREAGAEVMSLLLQVAAEDGVALVVVTHNTEHAVRCARRAVLTGGTLEPST